MIAELIGKYGYKKYGFFQGLIGVIEENPEGISPYIIRFKDGGGSGFTKLEDIVVIGERL